MMRRPAKPSLPPMCLALLLACAGCKEDPRFQEQAFLQGLDGEWTGRVTETAALDTRVIRETDMRLLIIPEDRPRVEFPLLDCAGTLLPASEELPDRITDTSLRLYQHIPKARGGPCQAGSARLERKGERLEYQYLGDKLRRVIATLERTE